jgi:DNA-binding NtrC family response regulator
MRNVAEQAAVLIRDDTATADDLRPFLRGVSAAQGLTLASKASGDEGDARERELIYRALMELRAELSDVKGMLARIVGNAGALPAAYPEVPVRFDPGAGRDFGAGHGTFDFVSGDAGRFREEAGTVYEGPIEDVSYEIEDDEDELVAETDGVEPDDAAELDTALRLGEGTLPTMEEAEQALIAEALRRFDGNRRQTAKALGISERTLYRKIKDLEEEEV